MLWHEEAFKSDNVPLYPPRCFTLNGPKGKLSHLFCQNFDEEKKFSDTNGSLSSNTSSKAKAYKK